MPTNSDIINRLSAWLGGASDKKIGELLAKRPTKFPEVNVARWRTKPGDDNIPLLRLAQLCQDRGWDLHELVFGQSGADALRAQLSQEGKVRDLLVKIYAHVRRPCGRAACGRVRRMSTIARGVTYAEGAGSGVGDGGACGGE